jgi:hypothetical protein
MRAINRVLVNDRNNTRVALPGLTVQATSHNPSQDLRRCARRRCEAVGVLGVDADFEEAFG